MWICPGWKKYRLAWKKWKSKGFCDWACGWGVWSVFFLNCFWWTRAPFFVFIPLCHPSENSLQWSTIPDDSPSKDRQSTVGWGTRDCRFTVWCRYQWATTAPKWAATAPIWATTAHWLGFGENVVRREHRWALSPISVISDIGLSLISELPISELPISDWESGVRHYVGYRNKLLSDIRYPTSRIIQTDTIA
jgi:hypothetical protein